jgi:hypothetical protein
MVARRPNRLLAFYFGCYNKPWLERRPLTSLSSIQYNIQRVWASESLKLKTQTEFTVHQSTPVILTVSLLRPETCLVVHEKVKTGSKFEIGTQPMWGRQDDGQGVRDCEWFGA